MKQLLIIFFLVTWITTYTQNKELLFEVTGICIKAPETGQVDSFIDFIKDVLVPAQANTLILRVDYDFPFQSYPQLVNEHPLTMDEVNQIKTACKESGMDIIPQINLLGHQSWHSNLEGLLKVFPEFDETPHVQLPKEYKWPNDDELYCKSYCPNHPEVHQVVYALIDEIVEAFDAPAFHAGMDEVFYIADSKCTRCAGEDPARVFADEVTRIRDHLNRSNKKLWIWGDRLIDGRTTGIGLWEASLNNTHRAIDMIPRDVVICDWHYEKAHPTAVLFAMKGLDVVTCPWRKPSVAEDQVAMLKLLKKNSSEEVASHLKGMIHTVWTGAQNFINQYYGLVEFDKESSDMPATLKATLKLNEN